MNYLNQAQFNLQQLKNNAYPGRGIILGKSPCSQYWVQVYWIMGRSENSRNRIFVLENETGFLKTKAFDESKLTDPSLIIYYPMRHDNEHFILTNGDQTDTIFEAFKKGKSFEEALDSRQYEPDSPHFTPRISGVIYKNPQESVYKLSILKAFKNSDEAGCQRFVYSYSKGLAGYGHFISTYQGDGDPIPSFEGEPALMPILSSPEETLDLYWNALNMDNKVSLMVQWIEAATFETKTFIQNKWN